MYSVLTGFRFVMVLYLPGSAEKRSSVIAYVAFLLFSPVPLLVDAIAASLFNCYSVEQWVFRIVWYAFHSWFFSWIVPLLCICAIVAQIVEGEMHEGLSALGLAVQAGVFMLLGVSWLGRIVYPYDVM